MDSALSSRLKVVYILGSSRSGSTLVDSILGTAPSTTSTGELGHVFWAFYHARRAGLEPSTLSYCSCGRVVTDCPVWSKAWSEWAARQDMPALERATERYEAVVRSIPFLGLGRLLRTRAFWSHVDLVGEEARSVARITTSGTIIDSSKGPSRGWLYSLLPKSEFDVRYVHLVRDGKSVVSSMMKHYEPHKRVSTPSPWPRLAAAAFSTAHWVYMNLCCSLLGALHRQRYLLVRFEDLLRDPDATLRSLESFLDMDLTEPRRRVGAGEPFASGHQLCGNRAKGAQVLQVKPRETPAEELPLGPSLVFLWLAGWLQWAYLRSPPAAFPRARTEG